MGKESVKIEIMDTTLRDGPGGGCFSTCVGR